MAGMVTPHRLANKPEPSESIGARSPEGEKVNPKRKEQVMAEDREKKGLQALSDQALAHIVELGLSEDPDELSPEVAAAVRELSRRSEG